MLAPPTMNPPEADFKNNASGFTWTDMDCHGQYGPDYCQTIQAVRTGKTELKAVIFQDIPFISLQLI